MKLSSRSGGKWLTNRLRGGISVEQGSDCRDYADRKLVGLTEEDQVLERKTPETIFFRWLLRDRLEREPVWVPEIRGSGQDLCPDSQVDRPVFRQR